MSDFDKYYSENPIEVWDKQVWDEFDSAIAVNFRQAAVFSPLVMWDPIGSKAPTLTTGREALPGHVNHNSIGLRQNFINAAYLDSRERRIVADKRYGHKVQFHSYDELINMWATGGRSGFVNGILRQHLNGSILSVHELLARDSLIQNTNVVNYAGGATSFAGLGTSEDFTFDIGVMRDVALRLSVRAKFAIQRYGTYGEPVPGSADMLVLTTPAVIHGLWDQMEGEWMQNLRDLQDDRIMNGGRIRYRDAVYAESWDACLWNAGNITKQVGVTAPITAGDGAPDPDTTAIDATWYVGQSSAGITHYVQCTDLGTAQYAAGDFVSLHIARTAAYGITNGVNFLDGKTMVLEIQTVDETNERLTFRSPVMDDYKEAFIATPQGGSAGTLYAFITKAQHVHPVFKIAMRGASLFAIRRKVMLHNPPAFDDMQSVERFSWDEFGAMNKWQGDLQEITYCAAAFGNRGAVSIQ